MTLTTHAWASECHSTAARLGAPRNLGRVLTPLIFYSLDEGASVQEVLSEITNQRTVPSIFVNKVHVGGCDQTFQVNSTVCF